MGLPVQMIKHPLILRHRPRRSITRGTTFGSEPVDTGLRGTGAPEDAVTRAFARVTDRRPHTRNTGFARRAADSRRLPKRARKPFDPLVVRAADRLRNSENS